MPSPEPVSLERGGVPRISSAGSKDPPEPRIELLFSKCMGCEGRCGQLFSKIAMLLNFGKKYVTLCYILISIATQLDIFPKK